MWLFHLILFMKEYEKTMLGIEEKMIKSAKRGLIISTTLIIGCFILIPLYIYLGFSGISNDEIWIGVFNFVISVIWTFNLFLNIRTRKSSKNNIKKFNDSYYERLKRVDNPRYLKETRSKKLKKLGY